MYTEADVRLLQRAIFLRRARGLNPAAIVHVLKQQGVVSAPADAPHFPASAFGGLRMRRELSLAQVARATRVSVGFLSALERGQMRCSIATLRRIARFYQTNILSFFETRRSTRTWCGLPNAKSSKPAPTSAWNFSPGATPPWSRISSA